MKPGQMNMGCWRWVTGLALPLLLAASSPWNARPPGPRCAVSTPVSTGAMVQPAALLSADASDASADGRPRAPQLAPAAHARVALQPASPGTRYAAVFTGHAAMQVVAICWGTALPPPA